MRKRRPIQQLRFDKMFENNASAVTVDWKDMENKSQDSHWESDAFVGLR